MQRLQTMYDTALAQVRRAYKSMLFPAAIVLLVVLGITYWASRTAQISLDRNLDNGARMQVESLKQAISNRFNVQVLYLRGATSTIDAAGSVDVSQIERYISAFRPTLSGADFDWLAIASRNADNWNIEYIDPNQLANAALAETYQTAASRAFATNTVAVSATSSNDTSALVVAKPYYLIPGGQEPVGILLGVVSAKKFFSRVIDDSNIENVQIRVFAMQDGSSKLIFSNSSDVSEFNKQSSSNYTNFGQDFTLELVSDHYSLVNKTQVDGPILIASGGALAGLLIASIVYLLLTARSKELRLEQIQGIDLAKDDLISLASHQLRTPATGVKQYLGMVLQGFAGTVTDSQRALLEKAYASNDRQLAVINEILHLAKVDSGRIVLAKRRTNITLLVQDVVGEQSRELVASGHTLKTQYPKEPVWLQVDDHMLRMSIENLVTNAIKYTDKGGRISVSVRDGAKNVTIRVADTGVGIAEEDFGRLFQQFARIPNKLSTRVSGTGVGLYLAKHLVELHKGSLEVESKSGVGSVFKIVLPKH